MAQTTEVPRSNTGSASAILIQYICVMRNANTGPTSTAAWAALVASPVRTTATIMNNANCPMALKVYSAV